MQNDTRIHFTRALLPIILATAFLFLAASLVVPRSASAGAFELSVYGEVRDSVGTLVQNAQVDILDQATLYTKTVFTDENGQYGWEIPPANWNEGDTIKVHASYGAATGDSQGTAHDVSPWEIRLDVTLSEAIPEFGSTLGALVVVFLVGIVAVVGLGKKRQRS